MFRLLAMAALCFFAAHAAPAVELRSGPFVVRASDASEQLARQALATLERALGEFGSQLPPGDRPITVIVATEISEFNHYAQHYASVNVSGIAIAGQDLIVVKAPGLRVSGGDFGGTLRHELVHILLARNTDADRLPRWLNEGLAMSLANEYYWRSAWSVSEMFLGGRIMSYQQVNMSLQDPSEGMEFGDAYAQSLSMTRFMRNRYGDTTVWAIVRDLQHDSFNNALKRHTGESIVEFYGAWRASLWWLVVPAFLLGTGIFIPKAILVLLAYFRKRSQNRAKLAQWEEEERDEPAAATWDELAEGEYEWELENEERADDWRRGRKSDL